VRRAEKTESDGSLQSALRAIEGDRSVWPTGDSVGEYLSHLRFTDPWSGGDGDGAPLPPLTLTAAKTAKVAPVVSAMWPRCLGDNSSGNSDSNDSGSGSGISSSSGSGSGSGSGSSISSVGGDSALPPLDDERDRDRVLTVSCLTEWVERVLQLWFRDGVMAQVVVLHRWHGSGSVGAGAGAVAGVGTCAGAGAGAGAGRP
jgi:hypothetical protein